LLHLLPRPDRIAFLQKLRERRVRALGNLVLKLLGQIGEGDVRVDRLDVAQQLIGQPARPPLERRNSIQHSREDHGLHDVARGSRH
jgi:hypothetical protein